MNWDTTLGSCQALLDRGMVITGLVQTMANRYIEDKTEEYSSQQAWSSIGEQYPEGLTGVGGMGNPIT